MYKLLIVEDDSGIAEAVKKQAALWDIESLCVTDFSDVMTQFSRYQPHIILLDIMLPFYSGYHWCDEIRKISKVPIIFISSASDNMNIVMAINMGGDDFIAKPFDMSVLMVKLQALLRRTYAFGESAPAIEHRGAVLSTGDCTLLYGDEKLRLTKNEYRILLTLMHSKGTVVSREKLMEALWESESFIDDNTLTVNVNRLRKKLDSAGLEDFITTKVGLGYIIE